MSASPTGGAEDGRGYSDADLSAAVEEASRSLGVPPRIPVERAPAGGGPVGRIRPLWVTVGLLVVGIALALALRGSGHQAPSAHRLEVDLRWAVAQVVERVEEERLLRGRIPDRSELTILLGEALTYSVVGGEYTVVGLRDGVRVEYDGRLPIEEWRSIALYPPDAAAR